MQNAWQRKWVFEYSKVSLHNLFFDPTILINLYQPISSTTYLTSSLPTTPKSPRPNEETLHPKRFGHVDSRSSLLSVKEILSSWVWTFLMAL